MNIIPMRIVVWGVVWDLFRTVMKYAAAGRRCAESGWISYQRFLFAARVLIILSSTNTQLLPSFWFQQDVQGLFHLSTTLRGGGAASMNARLIYQRWDLWNQFEAGLWFPVRQGGESSRQTELTASSHCPSSEGRSCLTSRWAPSLQSPQTNSLIYICTEKPAKFSNNIHNADCLTARDRVHMDTKLQPSPLHLPAPTCFTSIAACTQQQSDSQSTFPLQNLHSELRDLNQQPSFHQSCHGSTCFISPLHASSEQTQEKAE